MDVNRLLVDLCQTLDPVKRNGLRTLVQELTATCEISAVSQAFLERAPAVVGADLWHTCCEKQRRRDEPVPGPPDQPAAAGGEDVSPPDPPSDAPWRCNWCHQTSNSRRQCRGPKGPKTLCPKCNARWRNGETGPRSDDWSCGWCGVQETPRRYKGPKGPATLCEACAGRHNVGVPGPPANNWRCDWCGTSETRYRSKGPKGRGTLCEPCGNRFRKGKTGPLSATFACRWCDATSTHRRFPGPTGEDELCDSCGTFYARASAKIKARLVHVERELDRLTSELDRLTTVPVINAETGAETRERPPKRAREDADAAPPPSSLQREQAQQKLLAQVKHERDEAQTRNECVVCMDNPRAVLFLPCNHCVVCATCADALQECPFCNGAVASRITFANLS